LTSQTKYSDIRNIPQRSASTDVTVKSAPVKKEDDTRQSAAFNVAAPSADKTSEAASKSTIDINANPIHAASGKPITQINIDEGRSPWLFPTVPGATNNQTDLPENDKPWRKPGTDISDYFNYGFDEFTWALYAAKQESVRGEFGSDVFAQNNKKMMEEFNSMMMMGGMGMQGGGGGGGSGGGSGGMSGMEGVPPEMQAMMQQMMASGMDPSQMDPSQMNAMFAGMQNAGGAGGGGQGGQSGNFGGGYGGNQGNFGYDQNMSGGGGGGGGGRGGYGGGRGRRGRW
jgi:pre-mRNA 3'-end-processing factor FIP1